MVVTSFSCTSCCFFSSADFQVCPCHFSIHNCNITCLVFLCGMCNCFCLCYLMHCCQDTNCTITLILRELMVSANPNVKCMVQTWMQCNFCMFYEYCAYICHLLLRGTMCLDQDQKEHKDVNKTLVWHLFCAAYPSTYLAWLRSKNEAYCHKLAAAAWTRISLSSCSRTRAEVSVEEELLDQLRWFLTWDPVL